MRTFTSAVSMSFLFAATLAACSEDPPSDCGDASTGMAMVALRGRVDEEIRWCVDIHAAARLDATDTSAGVDESYAVSRPGVYPWTNVTFKEANEACGRAGKFVCNYDVLKLIAPTGGEFQNRILFDETAIDAVPKNNGETVVPNRLTAVNPYDMVIAGNTGKPPFPESTRSVAYFASAPLKDDRYVDETQAFVLGAIAGGRAIGGYLVAQPAPEPAFKHPLLGFRCCIDARMRTAFEPLGTDPGRVRPAPDGEVPLAK